MQLTPERASKPPAPAHPEARILIVDDEQANVQVMTRLFEFHGYQHVSSLVDPRQLLLSFLELQPDLLLLDLHMPHLDGFAVLQLLRDWLPDDDYFPIVVLTADVTTDARRRALAAGATDFLTKPLDAFEVLLRVEHQLQTRHLHRALQQRNDVLQSRLATVLDALDQIVWTAQPDGTLTYVSSAVDAVLGRLDGGENGARVLWPERAHPEDRGLISGCLSRLRVSDRLEIEHRIVRADGEVRWLDSRCKLVRDDAGRPVRIDGLSVDVTERRRLADEVARFAAQQERDRMAGELIATVSHELKTPLTALIGFASLLQESWGTDEDRASWIAMLQAEAERLNVLVNDILDVSALDAGRIDLARSQFDARELVDEVLEPFEAAGQRPRLLRDLASGEISVTADRLKLRRVLTNLVSNALKYSPDGSPVRISVRASDSGVQFTVRDRGLGLDDADLARLFQRFQRVGSAEHATIPGSGLGLYIAKHLVELHGGSIRADSEGHGKGASFTVELPLTSEPPLVAEAPLTLSVDELRGLA